MLGSLLIARIPSLIIDGVLSLDEQFIVVLYSRTCPEKTVNAARKHLSSTSNKTLDHIPHTNAALLKLVKRPVYQGTYIWNQCLEACLTYPSPGEWVWEKDVSGARWLPYWTALPEVSKACKVLVTCGCNPNKGCRRLCKCQKANLSCTDLCKCKGGCA